MLLLVALIIAACSLADSPFLVSRSHAQLLQVGSVPVTRSVEEPSQVRPSATQPCQQGGFGLFEQSACGVCQHVQRTVLFQETFVSVNHDKVLEFVTHNLEGSLGQVPPCTRLKVCSGLDRLMWVAHSCLFPFFVELTQSRQSSLNVSRMQRSPSHTGTSTWLVAIPSPCSPCNRTRCAFDGNVGD